MIEQDRTARGYMVQSTMAYIEKAYDLATQEKMRAGFSPKTRAMVANIDKVGWYPVEDLADVFRAIAKHHHESDGKVREALEGVGMRIGETATTTFLKLILKLLTPKLFTSKMPDFWQRDNRCGFLNCTSYDPVKKTMLVSLTNVRGYDFIGPVAPGFLLFAFEVFGFKNGRVSYAWDYENPGPDSFEYTFTWD